MKAYNYKHIVGFEETNLVGNVYFANHIKWQGRCREMFLRDKAPEILQQLESGDLALVTLNCSCEYFGELKAFDEVVMKMQLEDMIQHKVGMSFEYYRIEKDKEHLVARGRQEIGCMKRSNGRLTPVKVPPILEKALQEYAVFI